MTIAKYVFSTSTPSAQRFTYLSVAQPVSSAVESRVSLSFLDGLPVGWCTKHPPSLCPHAPPSQTALPWLSDCCNALFRSTAYERDVRGKGKGVQANDASMGAFYTCIGFANLDHQR